MSNDTVDTMSVEGYSLENEWRTLAIAGGIVGLIGILAMAFPLVTGLSLSLAIGALLVVGGIVHGVHAFSARGWRGSLWQIALAVVSVVAGIAVLAAPAVALITLTIALVAYLVVDGIAELAMAMRMPSSRGRTAVAISGVVGLVLAALLWVGFPGTAAWAIGLLVGANLLVTGISMITVAMAARPIDDVTPPATEPRGA
ncbi:HdeD family acid-resistance protein [Natrinema sp. 1APR25-10V2]|uniref:HdeD family acid-resistance protein n=1 Tax=Natrinema sp. 1APR25-10V2 TaxID=2951081 RepID=UPI0028757539|nr:HdeD family acid-resistance protein [Natrinema sp. 1APR25-10V2]MDS0473841.1 HdeD family acid-resistance protein [Natrinema sp. 1APR25-10V2]